MKDRKKMNIEDLRKEAKMRGISFLKSWTKKFLIVRLTEEDVRDEEIRELQKQTKKEVDFATQLPESIYNNLQIDIAKLTQNYNLCLENVDRAQKAKDDAAKDRDKVYAKMKDIKNQILALESTGILKEKEMIEKKIDVNGEIYTIKQII